MKSIVVLRYEQSLYKKLYTVIFIESANLFSFFKITMLHS